jgi:septum formation protein
LKKIILASGSPRRHYLLNMIGLQHEVIPSNVDEVFSSELLPWQVTEFLAESKACDVFYQHGEAIVIAADTIVVLDGVILNKPSDESEAFSMLSSLSGRSHTVITGVAIVYMDSDSDQLKKSVFNVSTQVTFATLSDEEIIAYIATGSPMDKAGAYGIQDDMGCLFISKIEGDYYNVVGLPIQMLYKHLKNELPEVASSLMQINNRVIL